MSIDLDWPGLTTGPDGARLSESIRSFLDEKFQNVTLPRFVRSVRVESFDFGSVPPDLEIIDICDPLSDFYDEDDDDDDDDDNGSDKDEDDTDGADDAEDRDNASSNDGHHNRPQDRDTATANSGSTLSDLTRPGPLPDSSNSVRPKSSHRYHSHDRDSALPSDPASPPPPPPPPLSQIEHPFPNVFAHVHAPSRYFRPFNHPLSGMATPLAAAARFPSYNVGPVDPSRGYTHPPLTTDPGPSSPFDDPIASARLQARSDDDFQIMCRVRYCGDIHITVTAVLLLDFPLAGSVGIPVKLNITSLSFDGVAVVARVRDGKRIHACFMSPDDDGPNLPPTTTTTPPGLGPAPSPTSGSSSAGILSSIHVESEIGAFAKEGKQALKNVGKVEKFVLEQVRRVFETELVFPSFWTFLL